MHLLKGGSLCPSSIQLAPCLRCCSLVAHHSALSQVQLRLQALSQRQICGCNSSCSALLLLENLHLHPSVLSSCTWCDTTCWWNCGSLGPSAWIPLGFDMPADMSMPGCFSGVDGGTPCCVCRRQRHQGMSPGAEHFTGSVNSYPSASTPINSAGSRNAFSLDSKQCPPAAALEQLGHGPPAARQQPPQRCRPWRGLPAAAGCAQSAAPAGCASLRPLPLP